MTTWKIRVTLRMKPLIKEGRSIRQEIWTIDDVMALPRQLWTACLPTLHFFFFSAMLPACGILIPLGTEFSPSAVKAQSPNHWTTRNSTILSFTREKQERKENPKQFQSLSLFFFFFPGFHYYQDHREKYQQPEMCRWCYSKDGKWRWIQKLLDEGEREEWKSWLKTQHSKK